MKQIVTSGLLVASIGILLLVGRPIYAAFNSFTWVVKDQNGNPLGGALVWVNMKLSTGEWHYVSWCSTNSSGRCSVTLSCAAPCELRGDVEYQSYTGSYAGAYPNGATIEVIINIPPPPEEGITVTGCVYHPCDPVGPVVGAHVYVLDPTTWEIIAETTTGADGCFTLTSPKSGPGYNLYIYAPSLSISGVFPLPQESGDMGTLELDADCELPGEEECPAPFIEETQCCPIAQAAPADGLLRWLIEQAGGIAEFLAKILNITFTLKAGELDRSEGPPSDANFHWAQFASSIEECDSRRISSPDEEPEETPEGKMCLGAALRMTRPGYRPSWMWASTRKQEMKWKIPLNQYGIDDPWEGDDGKDGDRNRSAHYPLMMGVEYEFNSLIRTPATEELVAEARRERLAQESSGTTGACDAPKIVSSPETNCGSSTTPLLASSNGGFDFSTSLKTTPTVDRENGSSSSQTLGVQLAQGGGVNLSATGTCSRSGNTWTINPTISLIGTTPCHAPDVSVDVYFPGGGKQTLVCGLITHEKSCTKPVSSFTVTGSPGQTVTITVSIGGNPCGPLLNNTIELTLTEDGCEGWGVGPPPPPPPEAEICNPPYPAADKKVCSDTGTRTLTVTNATKLILEHYLGDGIELYPEFTYLDRSSHRFAGILTEKFRDYKEAGIGGVANAFLPPGWTGEASLPAPNEYPTYDAPAPLETSLIISVDLGGWCPIRKCEYTGQCCKNGDCWSEPDCSACQAAGGTCQEDCCCWSLLFGCFPTTFNITVPLKIAGDDYLLIRYLGAITNSLGPNPDKTGVQDLLMPPQWGLVAGSQEPVDISQETKQ